ncbi:unnamed protein product [Urochloa humidicola]
MSSLSVRKSSPAVVRPPEPVTPSGTTIKLTSLDCVFVQIPMTALLVFEHPSHDALETIKKALSQALIHYSPFAGCISSVPEAGDGFSIRCTGGKGVEFVTASVNCGLEEAKIFDNLTGSTMALLDELAVLYPPGTYGISGDDTLLSVQATEFSCGGLVIGVTWSHAIADGVGIAQFLTAVGELARGSPSPSIVSARWDDAVSGLPPLFNPLLQAILACPESSPGMELVVPLDVTVPSALIGRVKDESCRRSCSGDGRSCTTFEAVLAVLWRCRVRATMSDPGTPVYLTVAANIRKHVGAKDGYYGNCVANQLLAVATNGAVASADIVDLVGMIRRAKDQLPEMLKEENEGRKRQMRGLTGRYDVLHVSSWRNVGFEQVDFGSGAPARVMFHGPREAPPVPICMVYPPCKGKDGVNVLSLSLKEEHVDAFLGELANLCSA